MKTPEEKTILYENNSGSNITITLKESIKKYKKIEIFYQSQEGYKGSTAIFENNFSDTLHTVLSLIAVTGTGSAETSIYCTNVSIFGDSVQFGRSSKTVYKNNDATYTGGTNFIYITKIIGYKD